MKIPSTVIAAIPPTVATSHRGTLPVPAIIDFLLIT